MKSSLNLTEFLLLSKHSITLLINDCVAYDVTSTCLIINAALIVRFFSLHLTSKPGEKRTLAVYPIIARGGVGNRKCRNDGKQVRRLPSAFGVSSLLSPRGVGGGGGGGGGVGPKVVGRVPAVSLVILGPIPNYRPRSLGGVFTPIIAQGQIEVLTPRPRSYYPAMQSERAPRALSPSRGLPSRKAPSRPPSSFCDGCVNSLSSFPCHGGTLVGSPLVWRRGTL
jgi:hypothetical protein